MAAGNTYVPIATQTISNTSTTTINFTSIPQTYTDLVLAINYGTTAGDLYMRVNSDNGSNYSDTALKGNGTTASSGRLSNRSGYYINESGITQPGPITNSIINFQNYSNTTTFKSILWRSNDAGINTETHIGLWRNTNAITSIDFIIINVAGVITSGSIFSLYGIAAA